jgi:hypothetical protein
MPLLFAVLIIGLSEEDVSVFFIFALSLETVSTIILSLLSVLA